ncbi:MAG: threonine-phosphate decarboxylase CobD [Sulfuricella sp.]
MLEHGGNVRQAAQRHGIALPDWLDLSTGINPIGWPVPALPVDCWQRLPESDDGLEQAARRYYGCAHVLPAAGSQAAIRMLPSLRPRGRVGVLHPGYAEHAAAWARHGHEVVYLASHEVEGWLERLDVLVLINPSNPGGESFDPASLLAWQHRLAQHGAWLVVDEAFVDATPELSLAQHAGQEGLIVLRSLGKFFGLAGARVGFVLAWPELLARLNEALGAWTVAHAARWVARLALEDFAWQAAERSRLRLAGRRLADLLTCHGLPPSGGSALFQWVRTERAAEIQDWLARQGIWLRRWEVPSSLRFGLPGAEDEWQRLENALRNLA